MTVVYFCKRYYTPAAISYFMKFHFKWNTFQKYDLKNKPPVKVKLDPKLCQFLHFVVEVVIEKPLELRQIFYVIPH